MSREWKPGEVALVNGRVCIRAVGAWEHGNPRAFRYADREDLNIRPLVVIDPEDTEQVKRLDVLWAKEMNWASGDLGPSLTRRERFAVALREFANPTPKPEEPTGLGAVVEEAEGDKWVRYSDESGSFWISRHGVAQPYRLIPAVRVLSEGVAS